MNYQPRPERYETMQYRRCGRSGLDLPVLSLGRWHNFGEDAPFENARSICRRAFDLGITHFDLANNYGPPPGSAEEAFGRILQADFAGRRDELIILTKAGYRMWPGPYGEFGSRKYILASLDQSTLEKQGMGCIAFTPLAQGLLTGKYLNDVPQGSRATAGKSLLAEFLNETTRGHLRALDVIAKRRGQTLAQMAIAWVLRDPRMTTALIGASRPEQIDENVGALANLDFSSDELAEIERYAVDSNVNLWAASSAH
jgi:aryl-alcohol dehydrogenase-like predicted oxidoreductase